MDYGNSVVVRTASGALPEGLHGLPEAQARDAPLRHGRGVSRELRVEPGIYRSGEKYLASVCVRGERRQQVFPTIALARKFVVSNKAERPAPKGRTPRSRRWVTPEPGISRQEDGGS